jgi:hypothetical protein
VLLAETLVLLAVLVGARRDSATPIHVLPKWKWATVNFSSNIVHGLSEGEMAAENSRSGAPVTRAGWLSSRSFTCTVAKLVLVQPERISELNGLAEADQAEGLR